MPSYQPPVADALFLLNDVLKIDRTAICRALPTPRPISSPPCSKRRPSWLRACCSRSTFRRSRGLPPRRRRLGHHAEGFQAAFEAYAEGGWLGLPVDPALWRPGAALYARRAVNEFFASANMAFSMYPGLTTGAVAALLTHGTDEQKQLYAPKMLARPLDRHDEPDRAALRHRSRPAAKPRRRAAPTAATRSPARRSSSPPANTI